MNPEGRTVAVFFSFFLRAAWGLALGIGTVGRTWKTATTTASDIILELLDWAVLSA